MPSAAWWSATATSCKPKCPKWTAGTVYTNGRPSCKHALQSSQHTPIEPFTAERTLSTPRHYAYLKIAEGCNRTCSYCAIPLIRGRHVSRPIDELVNEAKRWSPGASKSSSS